MEWWNVVTVTVWLVWLKLVHMLQPFFIGWRLPFVFMRRLLVYLQTERMVIPPSMPVACHKVSYVTMEELEKITSHKELSESSSGPGSTDIADQTPCQEELEELYMDISKVAGRKPAILTLIPQYSNLFFYSIIRSSSTTPARSL